MASHGIMIRKEIQPIEIKQEDVDELLRFRTQVHQEKAGSAVQGTDSSVAAGVVQATAASKARTARERIGLDNPANTQLPASIPAQSRTHQR